MNKCKEIIKIADASLKCAKIKNNKRKKFKILHIRLDVTKKVKKKRKNKKKKISHKNLWLILSGAVIGFLNGFFGGGGGMVCVPILQKVLSLNNKESHATAIAVIFPLSLISASIYVINDYIDSFPLTTIGLGVVIGGVLGAFILKILPPKIVKIIFAIIMFVGGIKLIIWVFI